MRTGSSQQQKKSPPKPALHGRVSSNSPMQLKGAPKDKQFKTPSTLMIGGNIVQSFVDTYHHHTSTPVTNSVSHLLQHVDPKDHEGRLAIAKTEDSKYETQSRQLRPDEIQKKAADAARSMNHTNLSHRNIKQFLEKKELTPQNNATGTSSSRANH